MDGFINGVWLCEFIVRQLCLNREMDAMSLTLKAVEQSRLLGFNHSFHDVNYCLKYLKDGNYVEEGVEENEEFKKCLERAGKDRRIKNPRRYCSQRTAFTVLYKPAQHICGELEQYLKEKYNAKIVFHG